MITAAALHIINLDTIFPFILSFQVTFLDSVDCSVYSAMTINFHIYVLRCNFSFTLVCVRYCPVLGLASVTTASLTILLSSSM
jgi:hypothetical protein